MYFCAKLTKKPANHSLFWGIKQVKVKEGGFGRRFGGLSSGLEDTAEGPGVSAEDPGFQQGTGVRSRRFGGLSSRPGVSGAGPGVSAEGPWAAVDDSGVSAAGWGSQQRDWGF